MSKLRTPTIAPLVLRFMRDNGGATSIEYAIIASGIAVAISAAIVSLGSSVSGMYSSVASAMK
jgi:pilus assembly protein Flp/PilA